jgi:two-component system chemotaxis response regulator CheY
MRRSIVSTPDDSLFVEYLAESREDLASIEFDLLAIEREAENLNAERLTRICRLLHLVKSGSVFFELVNIGLLAQKTENAIARIRFQNTRPTQEYMSTLLRAVDQLSEMVQSPFASNDADIVDLIKDLTGSGIRSADFPQEIDMADSEVEPSQCDPLRVLLVEDDFACRLLLQTFLSRYGECHIAVNGKEAVDAFRLAFDKGSPYNLICMDIMMPEMDGREAVRQIRASEETHGILSPYGAKIIMTTTVQEIREVFLCFRELCDAYLVKPIDLGRLLSQMQFYRLTP